MYIIGIYYILIDERKIKTIIKGNVQICIRIILLYIYNMACL